MSPTARRIKSVAQAEAYLALQAPRLRRHLVSLAEELIDQEGQITP